MAIVIVGSSPRCQSGYQAFGSIPGYVNARVVDALTGRQGVTLSLAREIATASGIAEGRWLWVAHPDRGVSEWIVLTVDDGDGAARDTVQITAGPLSNALTLRGTVRTVNTTGAVTTAFTLGDLPVPAIMDLYFFTNTTADGLDWMRSGSYDYAATIKLGTVDQWTRMQLLDAIAKATGCEWQWVRNGNTSYTLNLVRALNTDATPTLFEVGRNLTSITRTRDLLTGATVVQPRTSGGLAMGETMWTVAAVTGSGPYWVQLVDPSDGEPDVVREDGQLDGYYLRPIDGLPLLIADSRASDSAVQVSATTGLTVGTLAAIWSTSAGAFPDELTSPAGLAARGRVVQSLGVAVGDPASNLLVDPALRAGLASWETLGSSHGGFDVYGRNDSRPVYALINGAVSSGASSLSLDGSGAYLPIRFGDALVVTGFTMTASANAVSDPSGVFTVPLTVVLPAAIAASTQMEWYRGSADLGLATTSGIQALGAANLVFSQAGSGTPALANADTLSYTDAPSTIFTVGQDTVGITIPNGSTVTVYEVLRIDNGDGTFTDYPLAWTTTLTAQANVGDTTVSLDLSPRPPVSPYAESLSMTIAYAPTPVSYTFTISGTPAAWDGSVSSVATLTAATGVALTSGTLLTWIRAGTPVGTVSTAAAGSGATTLTLTLTSGYTRVLAGDTFYLSAQTLYANASTAFDATGAVSGLSLRANTTASILDNTPVYLQRCQDWLATEFGSPVILRLRGNLAAAPSTYRDTSTFSLYSPAMRVQSPTGSGSYYVNVQCGVTYFATETAQAVRFAVALWDADTGALLASTGGSSTTTPNYSPAFNLYSHDTPSLAYNASMARRVRVSVHPGGGQVGNALGGYVFLRWVALTVASTAGTIAKVEGATSNALFHRGQDFLTTRQSTARYRVVLAPIATETPLLKGGSVRLRSTVMDVDETMRAVSLDYALEHDKTMQVDLQVLTPRLSEQGL